MNILIPFQILVFVLVPLLVPRGVAAPAVAAEFTPAAFHAKLTAPPDRISYAGLPTAEPRSPEPIRKDPQNLGVAVSAKSALIIDRKTGAVLYAKEPEQVHSIASLSKLMTTLVVFDQGFVPSKKITIEAGDHRTGSIEYFLTGETVTARDLLYVALVGSSNTATAALARSTGLTAAEFAEKMNQKAKALGMDTATFSEPTGLDDQNRGSARDVARLAREAFQNPELAQAMTARSYAFSPAGDGNPLRTVKSTDELLGGILNQGAYKITAGKTGTLGVGTGYHVAVSVADDANREVIVVVLGSESNTARFTDAKALAVWAFDAYTWQ